MSARRGQLLLAVDVGGTKTAVAVAPAEASNVQPWTRPRRFATPKTAAQALEALLATSRGLVGERAVAGVGVSFGGHVQPGRPPRLKSLHVPGWPDVDLTGELGAAFDAPVLVGNDADTAARAEYASLPAHWRGADLAYLTVSTGVGGALVLGGRLHRGGHGLAGEVGHLPVQSDARCSCGGFGHLETFVSGPAIAHAAAIAAAPAGAAARTTALTTTLRRQGFLTAKDVAAAARHGDGVAAEILGRAGTLLGQAIAAIALLVDPDLVIVGGGVAQAGRALWRPLRRAAHADLLRPIRIRPATLGPNSALRGALHLAADATSPDLLEGQRATRQVGVAAGSPS